MTIYDYLNITKEQYEFKRDYIQNPLRKIPRKQGGIEYEKPYDEDLKFMYIGLNLSVKEINNIIGHKISDYLVKFKKREYMKLPKLSKEEMIDLYCNQHKTLRELADMFNYIGTTPIEDWLKYYEIEQKSPRYLNNKIDKETLYKLYIEENYSASEIAKKYHSTKKTILLLLSKYEIKKPKDNTQLSRFKSNHNELQNRVLLNSNEFEKFIIENDIKTKTKLSEFLGISYCTINTYLRKYGLKKYFSKRYNTDESRWLDSIGIPNEDKCRQVYIDKYIVDGFDPNTNTVYEYLGDYWHGNPKVFNKNDINKTNGKKFGELYEKSMEKINHLESMGYNVVYVWENDINPRNH